MQIRSVWRGLHAAAGGRRGIRQPADRIGERGADPVVVQRHPPSAGAKAPHHHAKPKTGPIQGRIKGQRRSPLGYRRELFDEGSFVANRKFLSTN